MNSTNTVIGLATALTLSLLAGCGSLPPVVKPPVSSQPVTRYCLPPPSPVKWPDMATANFWKEIKNWQGVPYRYGGISARGVDCSGLAVRLYKNLYGIQLPRTTREQINTGVPVSRKFLKPGDLVFFKFRDNTRHVGIYLSDRWFTHASRKKKGVTISCLDNPFWKSRYRTARRIVKKPPKQVAQTPTEINLSDLTVY
jgi:hypothetical protein